MTVATPARIADWAYAEGFRGDRLVTAVAVALAESSGRVEVVNYIGCVGLWQINQPVHVSAHPNWTRKWLQDGRNNARAAFVLSSGGSNWQPWTTYTGGAYRAHLATARKAAADAAPPSPKGAKPKHSGSNKLDDGKPRSKPRPRVPLKKAPPPPPPPRKVVPDDDPQSRMGNILIHGAKLSEQVAAAVTDASLSWATDQTTQLSLTLADPGFEIWDSAQFEKGSQVIYRDLDFMPELQFRINAITIDGGPAGTGGLQVNARSIGWWKLKQRKGPLVMKKASPSDFIRHECKAVGVAAVCQPTENRAQVHRDLPNRTMQGGSPPSSWSTFQRLASEEGFWVFEFGGTVYFGEPTWLANQSIDDAIQVALPGRDDAEAWEALTMPTFNVSDDAQVAVEISDINLPLTRFTDCRPGKSLQIRGLDPFTDIYLTTAMTVPLIGNGQVNLSASTPKNPPRQPAQTSGGGGKSSASRQHKEADKSHAHPSTHGGGGPKQQSATGKSALHFVRVAMSASNARYVYGAEASIHDPHPSALDCSELVQWALGRIGINFVDGSYNQQDRVHPISVAQAIRTRGALVFWGNPAHHVGISLGNGRSVEARNPSAGVGVFNIHDIAWTTAGLVPGVKYG